VKSVAEQTGFLARHLERDIGGNHLIKNIKALIWASACFSGKTADDWRQTGLGLLHAELDRQILTDGFHYEKSPSYHAQVFADLLEIRYALAEIEEDCRFLEPILDTMAAAIAGMTHPDGGPVLFNDAGLTMAYAPQDCLRGYQAVCAKSVPSLKRAHFGDAGYTAHRSDDFALFIDMGRIGPNDLPAHAHADIGTFELSVGGHRFVVDQGVFEYVDGPRRQQARDSVSHNVLTIDGESQAELFGAFRCGKRPMVTVERYDMRDGGFTLCGSHDGFAPYHVSRSFDVDGNRIVICDTIAGAGYGAASAGLLLHPDCRVTIADGCATVSRAGWCIRISTTAHVAVEPAVYWPDMGIEQQTSRLRLTLPPDSRECKTDIAIMQI